MELHHRFTVPAPVDVAWEVLNDLERVVGCFPGAALSSVDGDEFSGTCKVKLGPVSLLYAGSGRFVERDDAGNRAVIEARGKDRRGNSTAAATVTTRLEPGDPGSTVVSVDTDLHITGRPAQFGRGMIQDVSDRLLGEFARCLESELGSTAAEPEGEAVAGPAEGGEPPGAESTEPLGAEPGAPSAESGGIHRAETRSSTSDALDLGSALMPVIARRFAPYLLAALGMFLLWRLLRRGRGGLDQAPR